MNVFVTHTSDTVEDGNECYSNILGVFAKKQSAYTEMIGYMLQWIEDYLIHEMDEDGQNYGETPTLNSSKLDIEKYLEWIGECTLSDDNFTYMGDSRQMSITISECPIE